ncbi:MAG TPA: phosphatidylglycerophosphatase A [Flavisolibacter sp.]|jgi:phosphatidylglycerophosphatase A|nr:phosphatidylglycerophosphatase A [Flavisolibacter sp.]
MFFSKLIASFFGVGYIQKGAGTVAALFCCVAWYFLRGTAELWIELFLLVAIFFVGVITASAVEKEWGHDSNRVVIDEVHGMLMALFLVPTNWRYVLIAFVLFRFFDIVKPLGIRRMERQSKGWGVMLDDLLAGLYSNVILHIIIKSHLFS